MTTDRPLHAAGSGLGFSTRQLHAGDQSDAQHGSRTTPIFLTAGFELDDFDAAGALFSGERDGYVYSRHGNPTAAAAERRIAALEGGDDAILVASGQGAVAGALLGLLNAGDHLVASASIYEGTRGLLGEHLERFGVTISYVTAPHDPAAWEAAITPSTRVLFGESIPNPKNDVLDIAAVAEVGHRHGVPLVVDNTLATPYLVRPLEHGADVVVHSASKFLAGHGSVLGGFIVTGHGFDWGAGGYPQLSERRGSDGRTAVERHGDQAYVRYLRELVVPRFGAVPSPLHAFLIQQGIETLSLRVQRQSASALAVARFLEAQPEIASVDYAGLDSSPHHAVAERYFTAGYGSVFAITLAGGRPAARALYDALEIFTRMTHLGDVRSLILHPSTTTHVLRTDAEKREAGIGEGLLRLSIGLEDVDDLVADLERGLAAIRALGSVDGDAVGSPFDDADPTAVTARAVAEPDPRIAALDRIAEAV
ncbi:O-acetylhomoserine aminocarboxypropyltransferase/cysteine synthase family protein [Schumannella soli]|uniref:O-acetylhomoserine aminocarboxypropyltransferase/cysteine synthase family protein n=1 Tax=Schumannella soli TaxID=2590779 RepID=UPI002104D694|nr:PLP-dependent transferase [Schumannella soli]